MDLSILKELVLGVPVVGELVVNNPLESAGGGILAVVIFFAAKRFLKRPATRKYLYKLYSRMFKLINTFDIPIVSGGGEETIKEAAKATLVDESIAKLCAKLKYHPERVFRMLKDNAKTLRFQSDAEEVAYRKGK